MILDASLLVINTYHTSLFYTHIYIVISAHNARLSTFSHISFIHRAISLFYSNYFAFARILGSNYIFYISIIGSILPNTNLLSVMVFSSVLVWFLQLSTIYALLDSKTVVTCDQSFDASNWTHHTFLIILIVSSLVLLVFLVQFMKRCWPIIRLVRQQQASSKHLPPVSSTAVSGYQPSYPQLPNSLLPPGVNNYPTWFISPQRENASATTSSNTQIVT